MIERKPAYIQLARKCNQECVFCSNPPFGKLLRLDVAKRKILKFKKEGITEIIFTGGEPTLNKNLPELISYTKRLGLNTKMITNGIKLADKNYVKLLYKSGLRNIHVSIHSHLKDVSEKLSKNIGGFEKTIKGIKNAIDIGMHVNINSTINSRNCSHLSEFIKFICRKFPSIKHFVFNNLDPGEKNKNNISRAWKNKWVIARFTDMELELAKALGYLKENNKTFRVERVPLCYMLGYEEFSSETRRIVKDEGYICAFIDKDKDRVRRISDHYKEKAPICNFCKLNMLCAGVQKRYIELYGIDELFPVFTEPEKIITKVKKS